MRKAWRFGGGMVVRPATRRRATDAIRVSEYGLGCPGQIFWPFGVCGRYSKRSATMGSRLAALLAGI